MRIGGNTYVREIFPGRIDDVRIYNRALSATEIQQDLLAQIGPSGPAGSVVGSSA